MTTSTSPRNDLDLALDSIRAGSLAGYTVLLRMIDAALAELR